jgi:hypothetical protein
VLSASQHLKLRHQLDLRHQLTETDDGEEALKTPKEGKGLCVEHEKRSGEGRIDAISSLLPPLKCLTGSCLLEFGERPMRDQ